jgi:hypothetical protein
VKIYGKLQFILVMSDIDYVDNVKNLIKHVIESIDDRTYIDRKYYMLVSMLSGSYNLDTVNQYIN